MLRHEKTCVIPIFILRIHNNVMLNHMNEYVEIPNRTVKQPTLDPTANKAIHKAFFACKYKTCDCHQSQIDCHH